MSDLSQNYDVSHPFDREEEVSLQQLFTAFCNHLTLGQWEIARVCLRGLFDKRHQLNKPLKEILRAIIDQPQNASYGSPSVPSPFHLSWLCLLEYLDLFTSEEDQIPGPIVKKVEFRLLLYLACKDGPQNVIQDIDDYHSQIVYRDPDLFASGVSDLPSSTLGYLKQLLCDSPQFGRAVVNDLTSRGKGFLKNNQLLQQLYLSLIHEHLQALDSYHAVEIQSTEETIDDFIARKRKFIYRMLGYMDPTSEMVELSDALDNLFKDLLYRTSLDGLSSLNKGTLYFCFLGRSTTYLIEKFCSVENQMRFCTQSDPEVPMTASSMIESHQHACGSFVSTFVQVCYAQSFMKDRKEAWKYLYFHALEGNHILENMVETAVVFIRDEEYGRLRQLLSPVEFMRLKPLVLLIGWPYCYSCEHAKKLLDALWDPNEEEVDPLLYQACQKLAYQVQLVQWCTEKAGPLLASSEAGSTRHQQASEMFQGLETHSVLHVLHKSIKLTHLPEKEVFQLLRKRPVFSPLESSVDGKQDAVERSGSVDDDDTPKETEVKVTDHAQYPAIHPEVERDIVLYHSYCAIRNFMEAITASESASDCAETTVKTDDELTGKQGIDCASVDWGLDSKPEDDQLNNYIECAIRQLENGKDHLSHVYPLTYRVEILENIFSLLFSTYEDLYEGRSQQNDSDGLETWDEESRSLSKSSHTGSLESLTSSLDLSLDPHGQQTPVKDQDKRTGVSSLTEARQSHREAPILAAVDSSPRTQLLKPERSESDSDLLKKVALTVEESIVSTASPAAGDSRKTRLLDSESVTTSSAVTLSKGSSGAAEYDDNDFKQGFFIEDELVPEVLKTLKECLIDLNAAMFTAHEKGKKCSDFVRTSVAVNAIEQRISRLGQFINEANWRFQLVSWNDATGSQKSRKDKKGTRKTHQALVAGERSTEEEGQDEASDGTATERKSGPDVKKQGRKRKRKRRRLTSRSSASESGNLLIKDNSMIARMLSSPETLIYMCMRKNNYERAFQVIKMFNMAEKPCGQAAIFAEKYDKSVKQLESLQPKERRIARQSPSKSRLPLGGLGAVAMAAASGVGTSLASSLVDDLLATSSFAAVLNPSLSVEDVESGNPALRKFLDPDLVPAMLCVDLACTASVTSPVCRAFLDMAKSRLTKATSSSSSTTKSSGSLVGVVPFLNQLYEILVQEQARGATKSSGGAIRLSFSPKPNAKEFLLTGTHPIRPKEMAAHKKQIADQEESYRRLELALEEGDTLITSVDATAQQGTGHKHVGRQASFNRMERGLAVRVGMIELQKAFDCVENASHVTRAAGDKLTERLDYVQSLFKHVDSLATLLLFWKTRSSDSTSTVPPDMNRPSTLKVTNPFVVLNEGIEDALGRPMFKRNVSPKSLESAAKKLHVDLSKVIVYNCCPAVPSTRGVARRDIRWPSAASRIMNTDSRWTEPARDPNTVARDLLSRMIQLLRGVAETHGGVVDASSAVNAVKSLEFQAIARGTAEFQNVDLNLLNSDDAKVCFFVNTLNLLIAHASLIQVAVGSETSETEAPICRHASLTHLTHALSSSGDEARGDDAIPITSLERIAFLKQHSYFIGQLGPVSAFELQYVVLHRGLVPPSTFGEGVIMCFPERPADDPKRKYGLTTDEKRIIFAICDGCVSSPLLQVFDVNELDVQLSTAVVTYINARVSLSQHSGEVTLPELLHWYRKDFEIKHLDLSGEPQDVDVSLLLQIEPYLYPDTAAKLQQMLPHIREITFAPFCWTFGYKFEPVVLLERSSSSSGLQRSNSVPESLSLSLSLELSAMGGSKSDNKRGWYNLNETALEYLEEKSPLIAALVSLVCPAPRRNVEREVKQNLQQKAEQGPTETPNETDEYPLTVALRKTAKFPALQRYILAKLYTMADLLTVAPADNEERAGNNGRYDLIKIEPKFQIREAELRKPKISLLSVALAPEGSRPLQNAILRAGDYYLRRGYFEELLELINSTSLWGDGIAGPSIDFLLVSAILSKGGQRSQIRKKLRAICGELGIPELKLSRRIHKRPWTLLPQIKDDERLARLVLVQLKQRRAKDCIDLIDLCLSRPLKNPALRRDLEKRRKEITLYRKVSHWAKASHLQTADAEDRRRSPSILKQWQGVAATSEEEPTDVMEFLLSVKQFELAAEWADLHSLPIHFHETIQEQQVKHLLENSPEDHLKAYRILETLPDQQMSLAICESLLKQKLHVGQTLFIIQFMLTTLPSLLSPVRIERLLCTKMGAKALLCLPEAARPNYEDLVSRPPLFLEQLLMNMKVEWAAKVFQRIQVDLGCLEDVEVVGDHGCTVKAFDDLFVKYSGKALEFQVIQMEHSQNREFCSSLMQSLMQSEASSPTFITTIGGRSTPVRPSGRHFSVTSAPAKERGDREVSRLSGSLDRKSLLHTQGSAASSERKFQRHSQTNPPRLTEVSGRAVSVEETWKKATATQWGRQYYVPPIDPPKKADWMPDEEALSCVICSELFSMFNRRHHCRRCGRVVCGSCSRHNYLVSGYGKDPVRVCDTCHEYFYTDRGRPVREDFSVSFRSTPASLGKGRSGQGASEHPEASVPTVFGSYMNSSQAADYLTEDMNTRCLWKLRLEEEHNNLVREEFFYEQAPSAPLCVSILDLHSDIKACARLILDLCNSLSQKLVPAAPGMRNEEVDHNLVISMIRYLLFNAKVKMMKTGETQGVELCDTYLGHVDLMKFLVESNCGDIPSLHDLMHPDSARRLRDRLIESERLSLAMEVSTKCGLDPSGVWGAAGFAHLQAGDFPTAREKFTHCMKSEMGGKQHIQHNKQYLDKIINILESSPFLAYKQTTEDLMGPLRGLMENSRNFQPGSSYLDPVRFEECLFYLQTYGSPSALVAFYVRHHHIRLACRYILDKQCSVDVFIESLMMRLVLKGKFTQLKEQMETADPTLQAWIPYLTAACRFLLRRSFHHQLYEVQLFMRDYFRAAQTCIRFYEGVAGAPATSYEDLYSRLHYLDKAKQHIEDVMAEKRSPKGTVSYVCSFLRQRSTVGAKGTGDEPAEHVMSVSDLNSHLNTINLQVEVTNFMHRCAVEAGGVSGLRANQDGRLPTLFGKGHVRAETVVQVLLTGATIQDGFSLASRIIQDFNLPAARVYVDAGRSLARRYRYSHIEQLLRCSEETGQLTDKCHDDIILACVNIVSADQGQAKHLEGLIKLLKSDVNKINAFLMCGKLKSAYLIAVKSDRVEAIKEIAEVAVKTGQSKMVEICTKFLSQYQKRKEAHDRRVSRRKPAVDSNR